MWHSQKQQPYDSIRQEVRSLGSKHVVVPTVLSRCRKRHEDGVFRTRGRICPEVALVLLTPSHDQPCLVLLLALADLHSQHQSGTHNLLMWSWHHDAFWTSKLVPLVPLTSRSSINEFQLCFRERVVRQFFPRGSTSANALQGLPGFEDRHRYAARQHQIGRLPASKRKRFESGSKFRAAFRNRPC